jgi:hypothetical protein
MKAAIKFIAFLLIATSNIANCYASDGGRYKLLYEPKLEICRNLLTKLESLHTRQNKSNKPQHDIGLKEAKEINWQKLNTEKNLDIVYAMEESLQYESTPPPPPPFPEWQKAFFNRKKSCRPIIAQADIEREPGLASILKFKIPGKDCGWKHIPRNYYFLFDHKSRSISQTWATGELFLYKNKLHIFNSDSSDKTHYFVWLHTIASIEEDTDRSPRTPPYFETQPICAIESTDHFLTK